jgi:hypothetical protein
MAESVEDQSGPVAGRRGRARAGALNVGPWPKFRREIGVHPTSAAACRTDGKQRRGRATGSSVPPAAVQRGIGTGLALRLTAFGEVFDRRPRHHRGFRCWSPWGILPDASREDCRLRSGVGHRRSTCRTTRTDRLDGRSRPSRCPSGARDDLEPQPALERYLGRDHVSPEPRRRSGRDWTSCALGAARRMRWTVIAP